MTVSISEVPRTEDVGEAGTGTGVKRKHILIPTNTKVAKGSQPEPQSCPESEACRHSSHCKTTHAPGYSRHCPKRQEPGNSQKSPPPTKAMQLGKDLESSL